jgi:exodeoxyribonuclease V alpha subunit
MNPNKQGVRHGATEYRAGDKVMQIRNNYEKEVFNGDTGVVAAVNLEDKTIIVAFDERRISYDHLELDELVLAYATTIHKAQGSEYPVVILPVSMKHYVMLQRNLIYTGITRAKKAVVLVGEAKAVYMAVNNDKVKARNTRLAERLV